MPLQTREKLHYLSNIRLILHAFKFSLKLVLFSFPWEYFIFLSIYLLLEYLPRS